LCVGLTREQEGRRGHAQNEPNEYAAACLDQAHLSLRGWERILIHFLIVRWLGTLAKEAVGPSGLRGRMIVTH
jgi:hypothetical protein